MLAQFKVCRKSHVGCGDSPTGRNTVGLRWCAINRPNDLQRRTVCFQHFGLKGPKADPFLHSRISGTEQLIVGGVDANERLNTVPLPELPPSTVVPYRVLPDKTKSPYGLAPSLG